jgi:cytochrome b pre-mRNA-processing protein 3
MILHLFRRTPSDDIIARLYGAIVAQARQPAFYQIYGVPDTVNGRFEMVVLHAVLLLGRLQGEADDGRKFGQAIFDHFCADMDGSLREMGVGDLAVPRQMKAIGEAFYGRQHTYEAALAAPGESELAKVLSRNVYGGASANEAARLAVYARHVADSLSALDGAALLGGRIAFPDPLPNAREAPLAAGTGVP